MNTCPKSPHGNHEPLQRQPLISYYDGLAIANQRPTSGLYTCKHCAVLYERPIKPRKRRR